MQRSFFWTAAFVIISFNFHFVCSDEIPLKWFIKLAGSLNSSHATVSYMNGTVFARRPGTNLQRLFLFEGFNIGHQIPQSDGSYWTLTREVVFYRDPLSRHILSVWENEFTSHPNEVFPVSNDPVDHKLPADAKLPIYKFPNHGPVCIPMDIVLQYPNPLDPKNYPLYTTGPIYEAVELFQYHGNYSQISSDHISSAELSVTWTRKSQWLPWQAMGKTPGNIFIAVFSWKLDNVLDLPSDILDTVRQKYAQFLQPPSTFEVPNETSWTSFKKTIDSRRAKGQPDINILPQNVTHLRSFATNVDPTLQNVILSQQVIKVAWDGILLPEITNVSGVPLLSFTGSAKGRVAAVKEGYKVLFEADGEFRDPVSRKVVTTWRNPITKTVVKVPKFSYSGSETIKTDSVYSIDITRNREVGLNAVSSYTNGKENEEDWRADFFELIFKDFNILMGRPLQFYGTWIRYSNWLPWMKMDRIQGTLITRLHIFPDEST